MAMKDRRLQLHEKFCDILGSRNVYFQPPETIKMKYPCIVYNEGSGKEIRSDNVIYIPINSYDVTVIFKDPDSDLPDKIHKAFTYIRKENPYTSDNLHHAPFYLYY